MVEAIFQPNRENHVCAHPFKMGLANCTPTLHELCFPMFAGPEGETTAFPFQERRGRLHQGGRLDRFILSDHVCYNPLGWSCGNCHAPITGLAHAGDLRLRWLLEKQNGSRAKPPDSGSRRPKGSARRPKESKPDAGLQPEVKRRQRRRSPQVFRWTGNWTFWASLYHWSGS